MERSCGSLPAKLPIAAAAIFLQLFENNRKKTCIIQKKVVTLQQSCKTKENDSRTRLKSDNLNHLSYVKNHL
jgi:hypothetical protein